MIGICRRELADGRPLVKVNGPDTNGMLGRSKYPSLLYTRKTGGNAICPKKDNALESYVNIMQARIAGGSWAGYAALRKDSQEQRGIQAPGESAIKS